MMHGVVDSRVLVGSTNICHDFLDNARKNEGHMIDHISGKKFNECSIADWPVRAIGISSLNKKLSQNTEIW